MSGSVQFVCEHCGKTFGVYPSRVKQWGPPKYCSMDCRRAASKTTERVCEHCGKTFKLFKSRADIGEGKYCSKECYGLAKRGKNSPHWNAVECVCKACGVTFYIRQSFAKKGIGKYCSIECRAKAQKKSIMRQCKHCGKSFETHPSAIKRGGGKYCSKECQLTYQRAAKGEKSHRWKKDCRVKRICEICGKTFEIYSYELKNAETKGSGKYCSIECKYIGTSGERACNWQGGISFGPYCEKFNQEFRERVRAFFGHKCFLCGKPQEENGEALSVHHVNYDKRACCEGEDVTKDRLFVPLCTKCHGKTGRNRDEWMLFFMYGIALHTCGTMQTFFHKGEV